MEGGIRRVGVAVDFSPGSRKALEWALNNIIRKGDHLILITILPEGYYEGGEMQLWEATGSPLIPLIDISDPHVMKKYEVQPDPETLDLVNTAAREKEIEVLLKIFWGDPRQKLCEAADKVPLECIVIGNRGLGKIKRVIMGSVSNYVVDNASCPVTVQTYYNHAWGQVDGVTPCSVTRTARYFKFEMHWLLNSGIDGGTPGAAMSQEQLANLNPKCTGFAQF